MNNFRHLWFLLLVVLFLTSVTLQVGAGPVKIILVNAEAQMGTPYRTGGIAPGGFDCSGFVSWLYRSTVPTLPRISRDQARQGVHVAAGNWQPGDLLFYATGSDPNRINHVAIWYGDGKIIHSISDGPETGVVITPASSRYWSQRYITSRRILDEELVNPLLADNDSKRNEELSEPATPSPTLQIPESEESPWDSFDGILRGDFDSWLQEEQDTFEAYKSENG